MKPYEITRAVRSGRQRVSSIPRLPAVFWTRLGNTIVVTVALCAATALDSFPWICRSYSLHHSGWAYANKHWWFSFCLTWSVVIGTIYLGLLLICLWGWADEATEWPWASLVTKTRKVIEQ